MNIFNPTRLTLARKRRGLTGKSLADLVNMSSVHISRIENEKAENIEDSTVEALAKALKFPTQFFFGPDIDTPTKDSASFRSLSTMSAKERDAALSAGSFAYMLSDWVSERFNLPKPDLLDFSYERQPEVAARTLREYWGLGEKPVSNVIKLFELKGIRVFSLAENTKNVDAFSCWRNGIPYVFLNTFKTSERSRFDALHELGHLVLHRKSKAQGRELEREADTFASYFLMPQADLVANIPSIIFLNQLIDLKKRWGVSILALAFRLHKIKKISAWQYRTLCIQITKKYGKTEPNEMQRESSVVWNKIFKELWKDKKTKFNIAKDLSLPINELESLVFGLINFNKSAEDKINFGEKPSLCLVRNDQKTSTN